MRKSVQFNKVILITIVLLSLGVGNSIGGTMKKKIEDLRQKPMWVSHLGCTKGCLEYLGIDVSDAWLFGGTGHAFIINISEPVGPCGPTSWNTEKFFKLGENIGYTIEGVHGFKSDSDFAERQKEAWAQIRQAIDKELPCYGWELEYPDFFVIYGYDDKGYFFLDPQCDSGKGPKLWEELGKGNTGKLEVYTVKPGKVADPVKTVKEAFKFALEYAEGRYKPTWIDMKFYSGLAGFDHWIEMIKAGKADGFGVAYNAAVWHECRIFAVEFLKEAKGRIGNKHSPLFKEAIKHYEVVAQDLNKVSELFPFPPKGEIKDTTRCKVVIECLKEAREAEKRGLESLKKIVQTLE
ncbi:hypothetical protein KAW18_17150 [candidate division WOR-3 bacterium]|nr:hypothetical protein [candidate division WOR-3 bacterium]